MVDTEYGSGIELTQGFDFTIDTSGDISHVDGVDELQKDLSFQLGRIYKEEIGLPVTNDTVPRLKRITRVAINQDPRVDSVESVVANTDNPNTVFVRADVDIGDTVEEFVFEV